MASIQKYIAALDVGTTTIRCFIYNDNVITIGSATEQVIVTVDGFMWNICYATIVTGPSLIS